MDSGLQELLYNTQGWSSLVNTNFQLIDSKLKHPMTANTIPGVTSVASSSLTTDDGSVTATAPSINPVSGTPDDLTINANFTELEGKINSIITDLTNLQSAIQTNNGQLGNLNGTVNSLLSALRKTSGCGILGG